MSLMRKIEAGRREQLWVELRVQQNQSKNNLIFQQFTRVRAAAHKVGWFSIALAQAFQFDLMLRQKDVIGEWVPIDEPSVSDVVSPMGKWVLGLRWSEIDDDLILRHVTSNRF
jgi:hypothetical protein